ncbi:MAG: helix-turn-helix domain-containing protein, partial [Pseudomonadota bacterium]
LTEEETFSVGAKIAQARQLKSLSVEQLSRSIKVRTLYISLLESGKLHHEIAYVYQIGILKACANYLSLDAHSLAKQYSLEFGQHHLANDNLPISNSISSSGGVKSSSIMLMAVTVFIVLGSIWLNNNYEAKSNLHNFIKSKIAIYNNQKSKMFSKNDSQDIITDVSNNVLNYLGAYKNLPETIENKLEQENTYALNIEETVSDDVSEIGPREVN